MPRIELTRSGSKTWVRSRLTVSWKRVLAKSENRMLRPGGVRFLRTPLSSFRRAAAREVRCQVRRRHLVVPAFSMNRISNLRKALVL
jgi:hypothetical protein